MPGFMGMQGLDCDTGCRQRGECKASNDELTKRAHEKATNILLKRRGGMSGDAADANAAGAACRKSLRSMVGEIMSTNVVALKFDGNLLTADCVFSNVKFNHLPAVGEEGEFIGMLSARDFMRMVSPFFNTVNEQARDREIMTRKVGAIMRRNPVCAGRTRRSRRRSG